MFDKYSIDILEKDIYTNASLAQKVYFSNFYDSKKCAIYTQTMEHMDFAREAYKGGYCDLFKRGEFENIYSLDINSSYPYAMTGQFPLGPYYSVNINEYYEG